MKSLRMFLVLVIGLAISSCKGEGDTEKAPLTLRFRGDFGTEPLVMFANAYSYPGGMQVKFQNFLYYISDIHLIKEDGNRQPLAEVALVSFKDVQNQTTASQGVVIPDMEVPAGTYTGIGFGVGVAPSLNGTQPGDYKAGHPLTDNYWSWALGYIFTKIEGNADLNGDGSFDENAKLTFHIGANSLYQIKTLEKPIIVKPGEPIELPLRVDLKRVLVAPEGNYLDFSLIRQDHTNDMMVARFIMENLAEAITLE